ncbi:hypothetical protein [Flavobacterium gelatinilyticum]|uniref:hypothetical protein n=1 Tax=Flavobacterium gelatinilyticum TaxID=3003260 RepID=UPI00247FD117|nr:hypothetical protein [Flavobacterium gelatinilyticum]
MKLKYSLVFILFFILNFSFACDCKQPEKKTLVEDGIRKAEIIFYGDVIEIDSTAGTYTFKIIELFKGKPHSQFIKGKYKGSCSVIPQIKQLWIVYANFKDDKTIDISICSPSRGFIPRDSFYPPPPPKTTHNTTNKQLQTLFEQVFELQIEKNNLSDWIYQLEKLRIYKASQNKISEEKTETKLETYSRYIIISLIVNIVLFSILIFVIFNKKISPNKQNQL